MRRLFTWVVTSKQKFSRYDIRSKIELLLSAVLALAALVQVIIFVVDRSGQFQVVIYQKIIEATFELTNKSYHVCNNMGATVRALSRKSEVDPITIQTTWNEFVAAGDNFSLMAPTDLVDNYLEFRTRMWHTRQQFLEWKRKNIKENYDEADRHATDIETDCANTISAFLYSVRNEGIGKLSDETSKRFREKPAELFRGGGNGGGL